MSDEKEKVIGQGEEQRPSYPYLFSAPLPSCLLRPMKQPIYDTEILPAKNTPHELALMQRQLGQSAQYDPNLVKMPSMTNLTQPGQLANPLEFSLFGFQLHLFDDRGEIVDRRERSRVFGRAIFTFLYTGNRVYLQLPAFLIPSDGAPEIPEYMRPVEPKNFDIDKTREELEQLHAKNQAEYDKAFAEFRKNEAEQRTYDFTIGRSALRIRPTESFGFRINWSERAPDLDRDIRIMVVMRGLTWMPS